MGRRERWSIIGAILQAVARGNASGNLRLVTVAAEANVAYDRLLQYLRDLTAAGLLTDERTPHLTPKGDEFLRHYVAWVTVLGRFGLEPIRGRNDDETPAR